MRLELYFFVGSYTFVGMHYKNKPNSIYHDHIHTEKNEPNKIPALRFQKNIYDKALYFKAINMARFGDSSEWTRLISAHR